MWRLLSSDTAIPQRDILNLPIGYSLVLSVSIDAGPTHTFVCESPGARVVCLVELV